MKNSLNKSNQKNVLEQNGQAKTFNKNKPGRKLETIERVAQIITNLTLSEIEITKILKMNFENLIVITLFKICTFIFCCLSGSWNRGRESGWGD